ncbi:MAG TPA: hypothetical protein VLT90_00905 [Terriglobales bacterium]|nr:hypothetical protein [Terriglobales bacterium]
MFCTECGGNVGAGDTICRACGARVQDAKPAQPVAIRAAAAYKQPGFGIMGITRMVLGALAQGKFIRNTVAIVMQVAAVVILLAGLLAVIQMLKLAFQISAATATIGGLLVAVLIAAAVFAVAQIYLYRAQTVRELEESPFTIIPILSILFRTTGESYAVLAVAFGLGGCLFTWLSGMSPRMLLAGMGDFLPPMLAAGGSGQSFVDGLMFLVIMVLAAFGSLVLFYALAELVIVLVDIALNVRRLVKGQASVAA